MKAIITAFFLIAQSCNAGGFEKDSWKHPELITYESLRAWHSRGGLDHYHWPKEHKVDLNADGKDEVFLGVMGSGRHMIYALFTERKGKWILLSEEIEGSHHPFEVLPGAKDSWQKFRSLKPTGRGGLIETIYYWKEQQYTELSSREITAEELLSNNLGIR